VLTLSSFLNLSNGQLIGWGDTSTKIVGDGNADTIDTYTAGALRLSIGSAGNVTIAPPSSGITLTLAATAATLTSALTLSGSTTGAHFMSGTNTGGTFIFGLESSVGNSLLVGAPAYGTSLGTTGATSLVLGTNNTPRVTINSTGNVTIAAPSSGTNLTLDKTADATTFFSVNNTFAQFSIKGSGAGAIDLMTTSSSSLRIGTNSNSNIFIAAAGNVTIAAPSSGYALNLPTQTPSSATDTGTAGNISWDASFLYVCTAANTWKRVAIATW